MKKAVWSAVAAVAVLAFAAPASAQPLTQDVAATVNIGQWARLSVTGGPVTFNDADPDAVPNLNANPVDVTARARVAPAAAVSVTVVASHEYFDHASSTTLIPVADMDWTATGTDFVGGTMSHASAQNVASWTGPANRNGTQTYTLPNSWAYPVGNHTVTLTYTLVVP